MQDSCVRILLILSCPFDFGISEASTLGAYPFEMHDAAKDLEDLSYGIHPDAEFADVSWPGPQFSKPFLLIFFVRGVYQGPCLNLELLSELPGCQSHLGYSWKLLGAHRDSSIGFIKITCVPEAPNQLKIVREKPSNDEARRYRISRNNQALYRAAAQLWQKGVNMSQAIEIVAHAVAVSKE